MFDLMTTNAAPKKRLTGPKAERTRTGIKAAALALLREKPVKEIALDEICKRAEITQGALYFHFRNKDAAVEETLSDVIDRFEDRLLQIDAGDDLYLYLYRLVREFMPGRAWRQLFPSLYVVRNSSEPLNRQWSHLRRKLVDRICKISKTAQKGQGKPTAHTRATVEFLLGGLEAAWAHVAASRTLGATPPQKETTAVATAFYRALLGADPSKRSVAAAKENKMKAVKFVIYPEHDG